MDTPLVDIAFDCLPLRSVARLDVPLDASPAYRERIERMKRAVDTHGRERTYYLYNARCLYRFANSEVDGTLRFEFDGIVQTDAGDRQATNVDLDVRITSNTCGEIPREVEQWLADRVRQAVAIEFDRFVAAGQLSARTQEIGQVERLSELGGLAGMYV